MASSWIRRPHLRSKASDDSTLPRDKPARPSALTIVDPSPPQLRRICLFQYSTTPLLSTGARGGREFDSATSNERPQSPGLDGGDTSNGTSTPQAVKLRRFGKQRWGRWEHERRHTRARTSPAADAEMMQKRARAVWCRWNDGGEVIGTSRVGPASQHAYGSPGPPSRHGCRRSSPGHSGFRLSERHSSIVVQRLRTGKDRRAKRHTLVMASPRFTLPRAGVSAGESSWTGIIQRACRLGERLAQATMGVAYVNH